MGFRSQRLTREEAINFLATMAEKFSALVKTEHYVPQDVETWKKLGVLQVRYKRGTGHYPIDALLFEDESAYRVGVGVVDWEDA